MATNKRAESKSSVNPSIKKLLSKIGEKFDSLNQDITQLSDLLLSDNANHCSNQSNVQDAVSNPNQRMLDCSHCGKRFSKAGCLKRHIRIHTGERPFKCDQCSKGFAQAGGLKRHRLTHTGERPFRCTFCSKSFGLKYNLKVHEENVHMLTRSD